MLHRSYLLDVDRLAREAAFPIAGCRQPPMERLKLIALDADDLAVLSTHLQDAVLKVGDMAYLPREKRCVLVVKRFDWDGAAKSGGRILERRQAALRFERVLGARISGLDLGNKADVLSLLAIRFEPRAADDPAGAVTLYFAGGGAVQLDVECIEAELKDLGPAWQTRSRPAHPIPQPADDGTNK